MPTILYSCKQPCMKLMTLASTYLTILKKPNNKMFLSFSARYVQHSVLNHQCSQYPKNATRLINFVLLVCRKKW